MQDEIRPSDSFLFPDLETLFATDTASLTEYLSSHRKAICNSLKKWSQQHEQDARSIVGWISAQSNQNTWKMKQSDKRKRKRKRLLDGRQKETRRTTKNKQTHKTKMIQDYFHSILVPSQHTKRHRSTIEIEHDECISMILDTET